MGNIEIQRGGIWLPKPPLDVTGTTSSGNSPCYDQSIERSIRFLRKTKKTCPIQLKKKAEKAAAKTKAAVE